MITDDEQEYTRGNIFWSVVFIVLQIIIAFISFQLFWLINSVIGVVFLGYILDDNKIPPLWIFCNWITVVIILLCGLLCGVAFSIYWTWKNTIGRFNNRLNKNNRKKIT